MPNSALDQTTKIFRLDPSSRAAWDTDEAFRVAYLRNINQLAAREGVIAWSVVCGEDELAHGGPSHG